MIGFSGWKHKRNLDNVKLWPAQGNADSRLFPGIPGLPILLEKQILREKQTGCRAAAGRYYDGSQVRIAAQVIGGRLPVSKETRKKTRNRTKSTFAIHAEVPAIPAKPKIPAMIAITRNIDAHDITIGYSPFISYLAGWI